MQIPSGGSASFGDHAKSDHSDNVTTIFCSRASATTDGKKSFFVAFVDWWTEGANIIGTNQSGIVIESPSSSNAFTIRNASNGALAVFIMY